MIHDIKKFNSLLLNGSVIHLMETGYWKKAPDHFFLKNSLDWKLIKRFTLHMNLLESVPIQYSSQGTQEVPFTEYLIAAEAILDRCKDYPVWMFGSAILELKQAFIGLLYRLEQSNGGLDPVIGTVYSFDKIMKLAAKWKSEQKVFWDPKLSKRDQRAIQKVSHYKRFVQLLFEDPFLQNEFFLWTLRDRIALEPFILFPYHVKKIIRANLNGRIGALGGSTLKVQKMETEDGILQTVLTLPFEGIDHSILNPDHKVSLRGGRVVSVGEVFEIFSHKSSDWETLEYFAKGVYNWNPQSLAWLDGDGIEHPIDLHRAGWWESLPLVNHLNLEEAQRRYGLALDGFHWCAAAKSSRGIFEMTYEKTHAYLELLIPSNGGYAVYEFGKVAVTLPTSRWKEISNFASTVKGSIVYPDDNIYFTQRQHVGYIFVIPPATGKELMQLIAEEIQMARDGKVVYQIESENCGRWTQELLERCLGTDNVPNLYKTNLVEAKPVGFAKIFWFIAKLFPSSYQGRALALVHMVFAPWRGEKVLDKNGLWVEKNLVNSSFWQDGIVYLPSFLHEQYEKRTRE